MGKVRERSWIQKDGSVKKAWCCDTTDRNGKRVRRQFKTKREASACAIETEAQISKGLYRHEAHRKTVKELSSLYVNYLKLRCERGQRMTRGSLGVREGHINNYINASSSTIHSQRAAVQITPFADGIGHLKISDVTPRVMRKFGEALVGAGVSVVNTRCIMSTARSMCKYFVEEDYLHYNPASKITILGSRNEGSEKVVAPPKDFVQALLENADPRIWLRMRVSIETGVRAGELSALRYSNVDLYRKRLIVMTRVDARGQEDGYGAKSAAGNREIPLSDALIDQIASHRAASRFSKPDDLIFPNDDGTYESHDKLYRKYWVPLNKEICRMYAVGLLLLEEIPRFYVWHSLRHFAVSQWIDRGFSPKAVQTFAGHSSIVTTMNIYGHLFASQKHNETMNDIAAEYETASGSRTLEYTVRDKSAASPRFV